MSDFLFIYLRRDSRYRAKGLLVGILTLECDLEVNLEVTDIDFLYISDFFPFIFGMSIDIGLKIYLWTSLPRSVTLRSRSPQGH